MGHITHLIKLCDLGDNTLWQTLPKIHSPLNLVLNLSSLYLSLLIEVDNRLDIVQRFCILSGLISVRTFY